MCYESILSDFSAIIKPSFNKNLYIFVLFYHSKKIENLSILFYHFIIRGAGGGSPKWNDQFFRRCFRKNLNCGQCTDYKHISVFEKQISDNFQSFCDQNHLVRYMGQMSRDFDTFSNFL